MTAARINRQLLPIMLVMLLAGMRSASALPVLDPTSGHYYEVVDADVDWETADLQASSRVYNGMTGHLVTITSAAENLFLTSAFGSTGLHYHWMGGFQPAGSREPDGGWCWVTYEPFIYTNGVFANNMYVTEDRIVFDHGVTAEGKQWNDLTGSWSTDGYVVEYEQSPGITVWPSALIENLPTGGTSIQVLTICNNGLGDLNFTIPEAEHPTNKAMRSPPAGSEPIDLPKDAVDPRVGAPAVLGAGGPDLFGYRWTDSDESGGPAYNWIEISEIGTPIPFAAIDQNLGPYPLGFDVDFYGTTFSSFRACTNGWVSFSSTATTYTNYALPSTSAPENLLAAFYDDLNFSSTGDAFYHNDGQRMIIEYQNVPHYSSGGPYTFQIHIYPSGRIEYHYQTMTPGVLNSATIGIQNATKDVGLTCVFNATYVHDSMAIRLLPPWLSTAPSSGVVPPGECVDVQVGFNAADLCSEQYLANLHVMSNDPDTPDTVVPVTLNILGGEPDAQLSAASLDFGQVYLTQSRTLQLTIANAGCLSLNVTGLEIDNPVFATPTTPPVVVSVGGEAVLDLTFTPAAAGIGTGTLTITSDDPDSPELQVALMGEGLGAASIDVSPMEIYETQSPNAIHTRTLTISNSGQGPLNFSIPSPDLYSKMLASAALEVSEYVEPRKDAIDPGTGGDVINGEGGPDAFGYRWKDSDEVGGPAFNWIDISTTGTVAISNGDDENVGPFPVGFTFKYYGTDFTDFRVCANGFLSFTSTAGPYTNTALPNTGAPFNLLAPFWDDLNVTGGTAKVLYQVVGGALVVEWYQVPHYSAGGPYTFEAILYPDGKMVYQYLTLGTTDLDGCTVGIQNSTGTVGLQCVYNATYLHDNMAIEFTALPEWMTVEPASGTVPSNGSQDVTVTLNSTDLALGLHTGQIRVLSNDIVTPEVLVPVTLDVSDAASVEDTELLSTHGLGQNVPNPFRPPTTIEFALPVDAMTELRIYDVRGALVRTLVTSQMPAGTHRITWDGKKDGGGEAASGVYYYKLRADGREIVRHMTLLK